MYVCTYVCRYVCMYVCVCMCMCMCVYVYVYEYVVYVYGYVYVYLCIYVCLYVDWCAFQWHCTNHQPIVNTLKYRIINSTLTTNDILIIHETAVEIWDPHWNNIQNC